jgi:hypothetical protein
VVFAEQADWGFLLAPLLPGLAVLFAVAFAANNLPRPWGAGPWPRFLPHRGTGVASSAAGGSPP